MIGPVSSSSQSIHARMNRLPTEAAPPAPTTAPPHDPPQTSETETKAAGVLRLLAEGHFKGVADVRLRINFAEELQAQQRAQQSQAVPQAVADLTTQITQAFAPYAQPAPAEALADGETEPPTTIQDALDAFASATAAAAETFAADPGASLEDLRTALQDAFAALVTAAQPLLAAALAPPVEPPPQDEGPAIEEPSPQETLPPAEAPVDEQSPSLPPEPQVTDPLPLESEVQAQDPEPLTVEPSTPAEETSDPAAEFFASLQKSFSDALDELLGNLGGVGQLPPLSPPNGNGGAYAKFLAMYQALQSAAPMDSTLAVEA